MIEFYLFDGSPPCRAVWLLLKTPQLAHLNVAYKRVDLTTGQQKEQWFKQMNPTMVVPTLKDGDFVIWESRAIMRYLADKYCSPGDDRLFPKELRRRARVDALLDFDGQLLYERLSAWLYPQIFAGAPADERADKKLKEAIDIIENVYLDDVEKFTCGDEMTIADISLCASLTMLEFMDYSFSAWTRCDKWLKRMKSETAYDEISVGFYSILEDHKKDNFVRMRGLFD